jgi:hypothetical protein
LAIDCPHPDYLPLWANQFVGWQAFWELEPFGKEWHQTALLASFAASNAFYNGKHDTNKLLSIMGAPQAPVFQSQEQVEAGLKSFFNHYEANHG